MRGAWHGSTARIPIRGRSWPYLQLKAQPEYYENEAVKCGRFTGSRQTLAYVNDVIGRYDKYC